MEKVKLKTNILKKEIVNIFKKFGLNNNHALISSNALINAELVGAYGHGLSRLKMYCDRIKKRVINPKPKIKIKKISQSISHVDANNSIGFVAADIAIKTSIKNAKKTGIGMVAVKNSGHYGLSGYYAEQAVKKNNKMNWITKIIKAGEKIKTAIRKRATKSEIAASKYISCHGVPVEKKGIVFGYILMKRIIKKLLI